MTELTHWKKIKDPNYLGSWDLVQGGNAKGEPIYKELVLTIKEVKQEKVMEQQTNKKKLVPVCHFTSGKPMILNSTNLKAIEKACNSPFMQYWAGKDITVFVKAVNAFGSMHDALRIKDFAPKPRKKYTCVLCGEEMSEDIAIRTEKTFGRQLCKNCGVMEAQAINEEGGE